MTLRAILLLKEDNSKRVGRQHNAELPTRRRHRLSRSPVDQRKHTRKTHTMLKNNNPISFANAAFDEVIVV